MLWDSFSVHVDSSDGIAQRIAKPKNTDKRSTRGPRKGGGGGVEHRVCICNQLVGRVGGCRCTPEGTIDTRVSPLLHVNRFRASLEIATGSLTISCLGTSSGRLMICVACHLMATLTPPARLLG